MPRIVTTFSRRGRFVPGWSPYYHYYNVMYAQRQQPNENEGGGEEEQENAELQQSSDSSTMESQKAEPESNRKATCATYNRKDLDAQWKGMYKYQKLKAYNEEVSLLSSLQ
jgi:hypothetical protein